MPSKQWNFQRIVGRSVGYLSWVGTVWPVAANRSRSDGAPHHHASAM